MLYFSPFSRVRIVSLGPTIGQGVSHVSSEKLVPTRAREHHLRPWPNRPEELVQGKDHASDARIGEILHKRIEAREKIRLLFEIGHKQAMRAGHHLGPAGLVAARVVVVGVKGKV